MTDESGTGGVHLHARLQHIEKGQADLRADVRHIETVTLPAMSQRQADGMTRLAADQAAIRVDLAAIAAKLEALGEMQRTEVAERRGVLSRLRPAGLFAMAAATLVVIGMATAADALRIPVLGDALRSLVGAGRPVQECSAGRPLHDGDVLELGTEPTVEATDRTRRGGPQ